MNGLTHEDCEDLCIGGACDQLGYLSHARECVERRVAVEAIVARAVNEALTETSQAIEAHRDDLYVEYGIGLAPRAAYADAAEIVRTRARANPTTSPTDA